MKQERSKVKSDILLRVRLLYVLFILAGAIVLARLVWVQLFSAEVAYNADRLASRIFTEEVIPAQRGSILSRDGEPLATSIFRYQAAFDFASPGLDSLKTFREQADSLAKLLAAFFRDKPASAYAKRFREEHARRYRLVNPRDTSYLRSEGWISRMMDRMRGEEYVKRRIYDTIRDHTPVNIFPREVDFAEWETLRRYPLLNWNMGMVYRLVERDQRVYPQGELARRTIGLTGDKGNYGLEEAYREELAGRDGKALRQRIARGFYGRVAGGDHEDPVDGFDIVTTLDLDLQDVADKALRRQLEAQNALWGTTIVMEVHTGEILAMVNLGRNADGSFAERENYALGRSMEPGSTFKLVQGLIGLQEGVLTPADRYSCNGGFRYGHRMMKCHAHASPLDLRGAVANSCNAYFCYVFRDILDNPKYGSVKEGYDVWKQYVESFGFGRKLGSDFLDEGNGYVPDRAYYDRQYRGSWNSLTVLSLSIGQDALGCTPLQLANLACIVANRGYYYIPHIVKKIEGQDSLDARFYERHYTMVEPKHFEPIVEGMWRGVNVGGTSTRARLEGLDVCGKTGTAENPRGRDHSTFLSFAPKDNPKIAISVYVENGGFGASAALPIASLLEEYYLTDTIRRPALLEHIKNMNIYYPSYDR